MTHGLIEAHWKTERAKHHLDELKAAIAEFANSKPYTITSEDDIEEGLHKITIEFREPHVWIHMIAGDVFHCLRSALDYAVFRLAQDSFPYPDWTQFPIIDEDTPNNKRRFEQQTRSVAAEAVSFIKSLQPYLRPEGVALPECALWVLNKMCNIDKHRRIPVHGCATELFLDLPRQKVVCTQDDDRCIITMPLSGKPEEALQPRFALEITFGDLSEGVQIGVDGIEEIYEFVSNRVLPRLASFCKQQA